MPNSLSSSLLRYESHLAEPKREGEKKGEEHRDPSSADCPLNAAALMLVLVLLLKLLLLAVEAVLELGEKERHPRRIG